MEPFYLQCNFQKCRKILKEIAWVTLCSHVFCDEDGRREFGKASVCPACKSVLPEENGFVKQNLNPNSSIKPLMLAGLSPELISEVSRKGLLFWTYQAQHHLLYQQNVIDWHRDNYKGMEEVFKKEMINSQNHIESLKQENINYVNQVKMLTEKIAEQENQIQNQKIICENLWVNTLARSSQVVDKSTSKQNSYETHDTTFNTSIAGFDRSETRSPPKQEKREFSGEEILKSGPHYFSSIIPNEIVGSHGTSDEIPIKFNF